MFMALTVFMMSTTLGFAEEVDLATINAGKFGILTLIPPLVAIVLAFITKNVVVSLFIGTAANPTGITSIELDIDKRAHGTVANIVFTDVTTGH